MAAQRRYIARERNEIGLTNFVDSLRSLFLQIQHLNAREIESEYLETTRSHLQSWTKYFGKAFLIMFVLILSSYFSSYCASAGLNQILGITIPPPISMLPFWVKFSGYKHLHRHKQH